MKLRTPKKSRIYIHIPFCTQICGYCDFSKLLYQKKYIKTYIDALIKEIGTLNIKKCDSIYVGGGTPTSLSVEEIEPLLQELALFITPECEFTIECNVENTTRELLELFKKYGVNRLSLGVQSFNDDALRKMNRNHDKLKTQEIINLTKELGFNNTNIDLIYGVDDDPQMLIWKSDIKSAIALNVNHISCYALTVSKGTVFYNHSVKELDQDLSRKYYDYLLNELRKANYVRYEVSNFAKPGFESKHNLAYWDNEEYFGVGLGASGYINGCAYQNTKNINDYVLGKYHLVNELLSNVEELENLLMLNLRTSRGLSKSGFTKKYHQSFEKMFPKSYNRFISEKLLIDKDDFVCCTDEGLMLLDHVLVELYKEMEEVNL